MEFVDTHCHLQFDKLADNSAAVIDRAARAAVTRLICVGTSIADSQKAIGLAQQSDNIWAAVGSHPHEANAFLKDTKGVIDQLERLLKQPRVVAAGEMGLDFYKDYAPKLEQEKALRLQIEAAQASGLPFIFHVRDAWSDFWRIFDDYEPLAGVIHSFSSGPKQLESALMRGLFVGLNGIMTFTKDAAQLEAAKLVPLDRLVLETDAPFLTPAPDRGKICEPRHTAVTAAFLARLRGESIEQLASTTTQNALGLFKLS